MSKLHKADVQTVQVGDAISIPGSLRDGLVGPIVGVPGGVVSVHDRAVVVGNDVVVGNEVVADAETVVEVGSDDVVVRGKPKFTPAVVRPAK